MTRRRMPPDVWRLTLAYSLMMSGTSLLVLLAGIIGTRMAPLESLATLPIALAVVGVASSTLPTGRLLHRYGRKPVFIAYGMLAVFAALAAAFSLVIESFTGFCFAAYLLGWCGAAGHQYRFAALEAVPAIQAPKATSVLLLGGLLAAFIGPELAVRGRALLATEFAGSFALLSLSYALGIALLWSYRGTDAQHDTIQQAGRTIGQILRLPPVRLAIASAAVGYAIMSFIMTATPISMHQHSGHSLDVTKWVIQSHIAAMYLPSLIYPFLSRQAGTRGMMILGVATYVLCLLAALLGRDVLNYWSSLVLLGIGWNFLFLSGTNLLPTAYRPEERFRVQSFNDFVVFSVQALVSLGSGWALSFLGWKGLLLACFPMLLVFAIFLWFDHPRRVIRS